MAIMRGSSVSSKMAQGDPSDLIKGTDVKGGGNNNPMPGDGGVATKAPYGNASGVSTGFKPLGKPVLGDGSANG